MLALQRVARTQEEIRLDRWFAEGCALYIRPWYRKVTWFAGWTVRWLVGRVP